MRWQPKTYNDHVKGVKEINRPKKTIRIRGTKHRTNCDCGKEVRLGMLIDIRDVPKVMTLGQEFACDGCHTLMRRKFKIDLVTWLSYLNAPETLLNKYRADRDNESSHKRANEAKKVQVRKDKTDLLKWVKKIKKEKEKEEKEKEINHG